jgi:site-specific recombinase XerC
MKLNKLHVSAREDFRVFSHLAGDGALESRAASHLPVVSWPNRRPCIEANLFINRLLDRGYSVKGGGGTLSTYATYLSHLLRYCFLSNKLACEITDADFRFAFVQLSTYDSKKGKSRNNRTSSVKVAAVWLDFLTLVGTFYRLDDFISQTKENFDAGVGTIKAYKKQYTVKLPNGKIRTEERWYHPIFPNSRGEEQERMPLSEADVAKLRESADDAATPHFLRQRRLTMLELFETLGFRRLEAVLLRARDIEDALEQNDKAETSGDNAFVPSITFRSVKKRGNLIYQRKVPVNRITLAFLRSFNNLRKRHLDDLGIVDTPDSAFLVSYTTGKRLRANTITQEFRVLAGKAGIFGPCCPHMMRHRFITQAFIRLIENHQLTNFDEFKRLLLDSSRFKRQVMEYSGHANEESLDRYIHLAFDQVASFKKVLDRTELENALDAMERSKDRLRAAQARGEAPYTHYEELARAIEQVEALRVRVRAGN